MKNKIIKNTIEIKFKNTKKGYDKNIITKIKKKWE